MTDSRTRWTDDRIDDLAAIVHKNASRQDSTQNVVAAHDLKLVEIDRERAADTDARRRSTERHFALWLVLLGQIATIIALFVAHK